MISQRLLATVLWLAAWSTSGAATKSAEPAHVAQGSEISLADYLVPGKTVVFDFYSDYCPPCRVYTEPLKALHASRDDVVVVKVDINRPGVKGIDWKSPVARQHEMHSIPAFKVYGPDGTLRADGQAARSAVKDMLKDLR